ncbi:hypothetical protein RIR_jg29536.t1 [Rhizophagus irregularis DAOM 181602=DAOM 197198]|nr:hypothetical protein RIR_jg29536.t1 [Rhizophagus irregularis DAOM 181602=DAOM 197198]
MHLSSKRSNMKEEKAERNYSVEFVHKKVPQTKKLCWTRNLLTGTTSIHPFITFFNLLFWLFYFRLFGNTSFPGLILSSNAIYFASSRYFKAVLYGESGGNLDSIIK